MRVADDVIVGADSEHDGFRVTVGNPVTAPSAVEVQTYMLALSRRDGRRTP
jgi:hypothetical protein